MFRAGLLAVVLSSACGDQEQFIIVNVYMDTPSLVMVNTNGEWATPQLIAPQQYGFAADGDYKFVAVCENDDGTFAADEVVGRPDPEIIGWNFYPVFDPTVTGGCNGPAEDDTSDRVVVSGTISGMAELDTYSAGTESVQGAAAWDYSMRVKPGIHDVVASTALTDLDSRVVIRRGVDLRTSQVLSPIDLDGERVSMVDAPIEVTNAANATTDVRVYIGDAASTHVSHRTDTQFTVLDPSTLLPGEDEELTLMVGMGFTSMEARAYLTPDLGPIVLPPPVSATYHESSDGVFAHWGPLAEFSYMAMTLEDRKSLSSVLVISQHDYATTKGQIDFEAPPNYPARWMPSWTQHLAESFPRFDVVSSDASWFYTSSTSSDGDDKSDVNVRRWKSRGRRMRSSLTP